MIRAAIPDLTQRFDNRPHGLDGLPRPDQGCGSVSLAPISGAAPRDLNGMVNRLGESSHARGQMPST